MSDVTVLIFIISEVPIGEVSRNLESTPGMITLLWRVLIHTEKNPPISYDYGSSIRESRLLSDKFDELKRQGIFLRSSPGFYKTDWVGDTDTTMPGVTVNGSEAYVTWLRNPDTGAGFYIVRQANSSSL